MIHSDHDIYSYDDLLIGNPSAVIVNPSGAYWDGVIDGSGFSDAQMMAMYDGTQSTFADVADILPIEIVPSMTKSIMSHCDTHGSQQQDVNTNNANNFEFKLRGKMVGPCSSTPPLKNVPRNRSEKAKLNHKRLTIINEMLQALQKLLPESLKGSPRDSIIENTMGHIKHLQLQIKELSASRLGGESTLAPLINLEGHGHYYPCDKIHTKFLEEAVGDLMEGNLAAASKVLEGKGLHIVPIASIDALHGVDEI